MKHQITINQENKTQHIIHLDQHLPIKIKPLPKTVAYQIKDTQILATTTKTLLQTKINTIRQKNKTITQRIHMIIIRNTEIIPEIQIQTIKENPQITIHTTKPNEITIMLQKISIKSLIRFILISSLFF